MALKALRWLIVVSLSACGGDEAAEVTLNPAEEPAPHGIAGADAQLLGAAMAHLQIDLRASALADRQAKHPVVRQFSGQVRAACYAVRNQINGLARARGFRLSSILSADAEQHLAQLAGRAGDHFDHLYLADRIRDYTAQLPLYESHAQRSRDVEVRAWAAGRQVRLRQQLTLARQLHEALYTGHNFDNTSGVPFDQARQ